MLSSSGSFSSGAPRHHPPPWIWKKMPRGDFGAMTRRLICPAGPSIAIVSARCDFGGERERAEPLQPARAHLLDGQAFRLGIETADDLGIDRGRFGGNRGGIEQAVDDDREGIVTFERETPKAAHLAARRDRIHRLDPAFARRVDLVHHVGDDAAVVRDHADHLADLRLLRAGREVDDAVLLGEAGDLRVRDIRRCGRSPSRSTARRSSPSSRHRAPRGPRSGGSPRWRAPSWRSRPRWRRRR